MRPRPRHDVLSALLTVLALSAPQAARAFGGHDGVGCNGCHSIHAAKGTALFAVAPNTKYLNPKTKQPYQGTTALCLACHIETEQGGQGIIPVSQHTSHPFVLASVNPKVARVPAELLRPDGSFDCLGCHDPHPSNPNYKYLRVALGPKGEKMDVLCTVCHGAKTDQSAARAPIFSSMDETRPVAAPAPPEKPAAKK